MVPSSARNSRDKRSSRQPENSSVAVTLFWDAPSSLRRNTAFIRASNSLGLQGLGRSSSAPRSRPTIRPAALPILPGASSCAAIGWPNGTPSPSCHAPCRRLAALGRGLKAAHEINVGLCTCRAATPHVRTLVAADGCAACACCDRKCLCCVCVCQRACARQKTMRAATEQPHTPARCAVWQHRCAASRRPQPPA